MLLSRLPKRYSASLVGELATNRSTFEERSRPRPRPRMMCPANSSTIAPVSPAVRPTYSAVGTPVTYVDVPPSSVV